MEAHTASLATFLPGKDAQAVVLCRAALQPMLLEAEMCGCGTHGHGLVVGLSRLMVGRSVPEGFQESKWGEIWRTNNEALGPEHPLLHNPRLVFPRSK